MSGSKGNMWARDPKKKIPVFKIPEHSDVQGNPGQEPCPPKLSRRLHNPKSDLVIDQDGTDQERQK